MNEQHHHDHDLLGLLNVLVLLYLVWRYHQLPPDQRRWVRIHVTFAALFAVVGLATIVAVGVIVGGTSLPDRPDYYMFFWPVLIAGAVGLWYAVFKAPTRLTNRYVHNHP